MADRLDREYDRDRSLWRDRDEDDQRDWNEEDGGSQGRQPENRGEAGGTTRRGWGHNRGYDYDQERFAGRGGPMSQRGGRWAGGPDQEEFGPGRDDRRGRMGSQGRQPWGGPPMGQDRDYYSGFGRGGQPREPGRQPPTWPDEETDTQYYDAPVTYRYTEFWDVPGPYAGVGPQGYTRSADRLREDIIQRLTRHGHLNAANIDVAVNDQCEVTLTGEVDDRQAKRLAEDVAESVWGVNDIHNQIRVRGKERPSAQGRGTAR